MGAGCLGVDVGGWLQNCEIQNCGRIGHALLGRQVGYSSEGCPKVRGAGRVIIVIVVMIVVTGIINHYCRRQGRHRRGRHGFVIVSVITVTAVSVGR